MTWIAVPFLLQGLTFGIDEFYYHRRRPLSIWERRGHPIDTFFFALTLAVVALFPETQITFRIFVGLGIFSTLLITKDEWVHHDQCSAEEQWLHSLLFILHPVALITVGWLWSKKEEIFVSTLFYGFFASVLFFLTYQTLYWNYYEPRKSNQQRTLRSTRIPLVSRAR